jgi:hypothetical protein
MARHQDRDRIAADRGADRTHRDRLADRARDVAVGPGRAGADREQRLPDRALEGGALQVERDVEPCSDPAK